MPRTATKKNTTSNSKNSGTSKSGNKSGSNGRSNGNSSTSRSGNAGSSSRANSARSAQATADQSSMLTEFFTTSLKDIYWAEKALLKALPKMQKAATTEELKQTFADHLEVTQEQVSRCEEVFGLLGVKAQGKKCEAMEGLIKEAEEGIEDTEKGSLTRDVALIIAAQKVEHYEIASYGGLAQLARTLGLTDAAELLDQTLEEEKEADQLLTSVAENNINVEASQEDEEDSEEEADEDADETEEESTEDEDEEEEDEKTPKGKRK